MVETNGKIKLSWQQLVWGISVLAVILLTYADLKSKVEILSNKIDYSNEALHAEIKVINRKLNIESGE